MVVDVDVNGVDANDWSVLVMQFFQFEAVLTLIRVHIIVKFVPECQSRKLRESVLRLWSKVARYTFGPGDLASGWK